MNLNDPPQKFLVSLLLFPRGNAPKFPQLETGAAVFVFKSVTNDRGFNDQDGVILVMLFITMPMAPYHRRRTPALTGLPQNVFEKEQVR